MPFDSRSRASVAASRKRIRAREVALERMLRAARKLRVRRDRQLRALKAKPKSERALVVAWALKQVGTHEDAGRPNRGRRVDEWADRIGAWMRGQPWCGSFCWNAWHEALGRDLDRRTVSTVAIRDLARAGQGGYRRWKPLSQVLPGDFIVYGTGGPQHVGIYVGGGRVVEGNTSPGTGGSQADGGGVYIRSLAQRRSWVLGVAEPAYNS